MYFKRLKCITRNWKHEKKQHIFLLTKTLYMNITWSNYKKHKNKAGCFRTETNIEPISLFFRGANVQINGKKFEPEWGLYNESMGKVIDIVCGEDENPNDGQYVIVDFPQYCGPPWMIERLLGFPYHPLNYHVKITLVK